MSDKNMILLCVSTCFDRAHSNVISMLLLVCVKSNKTLNILKAMCLSVDGLIFGVNLLSSTC